jgi:hypothetical protein
MDRKIIAVMVTLVVVALVVVAVIALAAGGFGGRAGGFTTLFDKLENPGGEIHDQQLVLPSSWHAGDPIAVSDKIVDMYYEEVSGELPYYRTTLFFVYAGEKWNDPLEGTTFYVPATNGLVMVNHGLFHITVISGDNISESFGVGDVVQLNCKVVVVGMTLAFGEWTVQGTS